jgi:hypothetical protein
MSGISNTVNYAGGQTIGNAWGATQYRGGSLALPWGTGANGSLVQTLGTGANCNPGLGNLEGGFNLNSIFNQCWNNSQASVIGHQNLTGGPGFNGAASTNGVSVATRNGAYSGINQDLLISGNGQGLIQGATSASYGI